MNVHDRIKFIEKNTMLGNCMKQIMTVYELKELLRKFEDELNKNALSPLVSGSFVLYRTNGILEVYWNGSEWQQTKEGCPTYDWDKANEYAKVLSCKFTDSE